MNMDAMLATAAKPKMPANQARSRYSAKAAHGGSRLLVGHDVDDVGALCSHRCDGRKCQQGFQ